MQHCQCAACSDCRLLPSPTPTTETKADSEAAPDGKADPFAMPARPVDSLSTDDYVNLAEMEQSSGVEEKSPEFLAPPSMQPSDSFIDDVQYPDATLLPLPAKTATVDSLMRLSWYSFRILLLSEFLLLGIAGNMVYMVLAGAAPKNVSCLGDGFTVENVCAEYPDSYRQFAGNCTLVPQIEFTSLNVEFEHYCAETKLVKTSISIQMAGVLVGALTWGNLSDRYGRKKILQICFAFVCLFMAAASFSRDLMMLTIFRTCLAFFNGGAIVIYGVYKLEHIPTKHRFLITSIVTWSPNFVLVNSLAYFCGDWRHFQRIILLISSPALVGFFFVFESPRWLIQRGRLQEARTVLEAIQHIDGAPESKKDDMAHLMKIEHEKFAAKARKAKRYTLAHLFRYRDMGLCTVVYSFGFVASSMISYGLLFNVEKLSGSLFLNSILIGAVRWVFNIAAGFLDYYIKPLGRRHVHAVSQAFLLGCLLLIFGAYYKGIAAQYGETVRYATLLAIAACSQVIITKVMSAMEFYPTVIRNTGISFNSTWGRVGTILAPQIFFLPYKWMPYLVLGTMTLIDMVAFLSIVPETKGRPMPETLPEKSKGEKEERA